MAPKTTKSKSTTTRTTKSTRSTTRSSRAQQQTAPSVSSRPAKPLFSTATLVTLTLLIALVATVFFMNRNAEETANATPTPGEVQTFVFDGTKVVTSLEIKPKEGDAVKIERNAEKAWVMTLPEEVDADTAAAEAAASQVTALAISETIPHTSDPAIFGLDDPAYTITLVFEDGKTSTVEVGDITPSENGYYVRVDKDNMYSVQRAGIEALTTLVTTPPYLNTPTPIPTATSTPLPTETAVPATETSPTPEVTPTP